MPGPRTIGAVRDTEGRHVPVITESGVIVLPGFRLAPDQADELAALLITAFWQAARNAAELAAEVPGNA